jgi:ABC-2 type transport system ATP-binding protein
VIPALQAAALSKRFGRTWALRECSIAIPAGRVVALVGPNGAGKTTLMHLAIGLLEPSAGEVEVFGWSPRQHPTVVLARTGFVAQERPLYRNLTVDQMLLFGAALNPRWDQALATARLRRLGVPLERRVGQLSGGQQAQVALTLVLAKRPELLLLDEPVSNLDPVARREFTRGLLDAAAADGLTVVTSSHVVSELERFCDYLVLLNAGQVQLAGDVSELLQQHAMLLGDPGQAELLEGRPGVVQVVTGPRQATVVVRDRSVPTGPGWEVHDIGLEELVIAYMENPGAGALPPPTALEIA